MRKDVARYVKECPVCQKEGETRRTGLGGLVGRPEEVWKWTSVDHVTKLPRTKGKDSILVIQDQFSGMIHLKAVSEKETAKQVWMDYEEAAWKLHGHPEEIRSDRRTVFMSKAWEEEYRKRKIHHRKTTAYHPQANGQVEGTNKEIKKYLRKYMSHHQDDWDELLPMLEYAYNIRKMETRTYTPYQIVYGETPEVTVKKIMKELQAQERQYDDLRERKKGIPAPKYEKGDWIYMRRREGRKDRPNKSLDHK